MHILGITIAYLPGDENMLLRPKGIFLLSLFSLSLQHYQVPEPTGSLTLDALCLAFEFEFCLLLVWGIRLSLTSRKFGKHTAKNLTVVTTNR